MSSSKEDSSINLETNTDDDDSIDDGESLYLSEDGSMDGAKWREANLTCGQKVWKWVKWFMNRYLIVALTGMSQGLFVTLIAGMIVKQFGKLFGETTRGGSMFIVAGNIASLLTGAGIGAGIAKALESSNLVIYATMVSGLVGAYSDKFIDREWIIQNKVPVGPGNPIGSYINSVIGCEIGNLVVRLHTRLDILLVPLFVIISAIGGAYACWPFRTVGSYIADWIAYAMNVQPIIMSIVMSTWIGLLLTLPTSSAAT